MTVATGPVIEDLNVIEDIRPGQIPGFIYAFSDSFFFQRTEEQFGHRIIPAVATPDHGYWSGRFVASRRCRTGCPDGYVR